MTDQTFQPNPTDPTQTTIPSQGGVFGGFVGVEEAAIPKVPDTSLLFEKTEETSTPVVDIPVAEIPVVEETATFENLNLDTSSEFVTDEPVVEDTPVIEEIPAPVVEEIATPVVEETPVEETPVVEEVVEEVIPTPVIEETPVVETPVVEETPVEETPVVEVSDVKAKYNELANNIGVLSNGSTEAIQIVGSNTDSAHVEYTFTKDEDILEVTRTETNKETEDSSENIIAFVSSLDDGQIQVFLDDTLLFEEEELLADPKKKMQVMEKFNKFIFLTGEKLKDVEKARKAQEAELQEKRRLQDIFRNF
jgi:hypothetical protein